jgi:N-acetyl-anhydromuramyl-L-alanine amidase AmpD
MTINTETLSLPLNQYIQQESAKSGIVLHHTVGGTAKSTVDYWKQTRDRIATAFVVERDGTIYQCFDPKFWAYHIGDGSNEFDNKRFIGIELASEGALIEKAGQLYKFNARRGNEVRRENIYDNGVPYRGFRYFDTYDAPQIAATIWLVNDLLTRFNIKRQTPKSHTEYLPSWKRFFGVVSHTHLRRDKSDVHPGFAWKQLVEQCSLTLI